MSRLDLTFLGKTYPIRCTDGEEDRVQQLADYIEERLERLAVHEQRQGNSVNDTRLMMLGCLMLADEVMDLKNQRSRLGFDAPAERAEPSLESTMVAAVEDLAGRLNELATRLAG